MTGKPKPPWDCHNDADRNALIKWTNKQLEPAALRELSDEEYYSDDGYYLRMQLNENYNASWEEDYGECLKRGRAVNAADNLIAMIGDDQELLLLIERKFAKRRAASHKPGQGRKKGTARPTDRTSLEHRRRASALQDAARIRALWLQAFGKARRRKGGYKPSSLEIAAGRHGLIVVGSVVRFPDK